MLDCAESVPFDGAAATPTAITVAVAVDEEEAAESLSNDDRAAEASLGSLSRGVAINDEFPIPG